MSTTAEIRSEVQTLHTQIREKLLAAAEKAYEGVSKYFPKEPGEKLGAISNQSAAGDVELESNPVHPT